MHGHSTIQQYPPLEAQLQGTLNVIPALTWYASPSGALTFVSERTADYLGLPKDHPLRFGINTGAEWDSHIPLLHPDDHEETRRVWSTCLRTGLAGEVTFRVRNAEGEYRWFLSRAEPLRASDGTLLYWIGVNLDIEERKRAEFYLAEGQRLAHMGSCAFSSAGFEYWSPELFQIHGLDPGGNSPTMQEYLALVHAEDRDFVQQEIQKMLEHHQGFDFTKRIVRADGAIRRVRWVGVAISYQGNFRRFVATGIDVTEQEELTRELRRSKKHLTNAQTLSHTGSVGMELSTKRIFWSEESARIYGYPPGTEPTADLILQRVHPDDVTLLKDLLKRAAQGGEDFDFEHRLLMPDGSTKYIYNLSQCVRDEAGNEEVLGAIVDITQHKLAEEAIRRNAAYLAEAQRLSRTGSFGWNPGTGEIIWSEETYRIFEYEHSEKPTLDMALQRVHPDERTFAQEVIERASTVGTDFKLECRLLMPSGAIKHIHVRAHALHDSPGKIEFIGAVTDITERKAAHEKIREQEAELRQMLDFVPQLVAVFGPDHERIYANRMGLDYLGVTLEEWTQTRDMRVFVHPDDGDRMRALFNRALSTGSAYELEYRVRKSNGSYRWFLARYNPVHDDLGRVARWYVAFTDIEDRKRAEERLREENAALREEIAKASMFEEIVGTSPALATILGHVSKVSPSDSTVLITGETGTGKELVARAIHRRSPRASRPFVSVNCAAIPRDLVGSELFGHEKGAFTGATQQRLGRFELASGGTIFLDEVGELPAETQIALLRVLQEHEFERVGGSRRIRADVRVIAATNRDLQAAISARTFRSDLFYRLHVFPIQIPSLRERRTDIPLLVEYFIDRYARKAGKNIKHVNKKTLELLESYPWPGNIRELQNVIERSVILCETEIFSIDEKWLPQQPNMAKAARHQSELPRTLLTQEKNMIEEALKESRGRVSGPTGAAAKLGIARSTLESKIRSLKIDKNRFRALSEI